MIVSECRILRARIVLEKAKNAHQGAVFIETEYHNERLFNAKLLQRMKRDTRKKRRQMDRARKNLESKLTMEREMIQESQGKFCF